MLMAKQIYKLRNWSEYNKNLVERGSINFWFPEETTMCWYHNSATKQKGGQLIYSDLAIITCLIIRSRYDLTLRETQGFVQSILGMNNIGIKCPDYTALSRRAQKLDIEIPRLKGVGPIDVVVDSTGFKIYGEGEWKVRQHGYSKRRTWTKLHVAINPKTHEIVSGVVTSSKVTDDKALPEILDHIARPINTVATDGAYDKKDCYIAINAKNATPIIPPRKDAVVSNDPDLIIRDFAVEYIRRLGNDEDARKKWKQNSGYHMRSIAETGMFRLKKIFSNQLRSRKPKTQEVELKARIAILNRMTFNGMPDSYRVQ